MAGFFSSTFAHTSCNGACRYAHTTPTTHSGNLPCMHTLDKQYLTCAYTFTDKHTRTYTLKPSALSNTHAHIHPSALCIQTRTRTHIPNDVVTQQQQLQQDSTTEHIHSPRTPEDLTTQVQQRLHF